MKKMLYGIICLFSLIALTNKVYASSFELSLVSEDEFTDEIIVNIEVTKLIDFPSGLCQYKGMEKTDAWGRS